MCRNFVTNSPNPHILALDSYPVFEYRVTNSMYIIYILPCISLVPLIPSPAIGAKVVGFERVPLHSFIHRPMGSTSIPLLSWSAPFLVILYTMETLTSLQLHVTNFIQQSKMLWLDKGRVGGGSTTQHPLTNIVFTSAETWEDWVDIGCFLQAFSNIYGITICVWRLFLVPTSTTFHPLHNCHINLQ